MKQKPGTYKDCIALSRKLNIPVQKIAMAFGIKLPNHDDLMKRLAEAKTQMERHEILCDSRPGSPAAKAVSAAIEQQSRHDLAEAQTIERKKRIYEESLSDSASELEIIVSICTHH
jgi:hypothetical protein